VKLNLYYNPNMQWAKNTLCQLRYHICHVSNGMSNDQLLACEIPPCFISLNIGLIFQEKDKYWHYNGGELYRIQTEKFTEKKALIGDKFITKTRSSTSVKNYNTMLPNPKYKGGGPFLIHWRKSSRGW